MPVTRSQNGIIISPAQLAQLKTLLNGDQVMADCLANMMEGKAAVVLTPPVYDQNNEIFVHKYRDDDGSNHSLRLMTQAQLLAFYRDVLKLDDAPNPGVES